MMTSTKAFWELWPPVETGGSLARVRPSSTLGNMQEGLLYRTQLAPQPNISARQKCQTGSADDLSWSHRVRFASFPISVIASCMSACSVSLGGQDYIANGALKCSHWVVTQLAQSQCVRWPHIEATAQRKVDVVRCEIYCFETRVPPRRSPGSLDHPRVDASTNMFLVPLSFDNIETETSLNHRATSF